MDLADAHHLRGVAERLATDAELIAALHWQVPPPDPAPADGAWHGPAALAFAAVAGELALEADAVSALLIDLVGRLAADVVRLRELALLAEISAAVPLL